MVFSGAFSKKSMLLAAMLAGSFVAGVAFKAYSDAGPASAPLSYIADPQTYHLLKENDQFRVIMAKRPPGHKDAWHSHSALALYSLTDCQGHLFSADGKVIDVKSKAGTVILNPATPSHTADNTGTTECDQLIVERK
jgi:hypothetical protein